MTIDHLATKKIGILGLGVNNLQLVLFLAGQGIRLAVRERKDAVKEDFEARYPELARLVTWQIGERTLDGLQEFEVLFRSPVIPYLSPPLQQAMKKGVVLYSQTKLFFDLCPCPIVGVSGTKGKGTTSTLIYRILTAGYRQGKSYLAGNIGVDPFSFLEQLRPEDRVVLELSSFQLQDLHKSPQFAVLLRVSSDHLDHHASLQEYREAKKPLLAFQQPDDAAIINVEAPEMAEFAASAPGRHYLYAKYQPRRQSAWVDESTGREVVFVQIDDQLTSFDIQDRRLIGAHNLENILPAALVGALHGIPADILQREICAFPGLER